MGLYPFMGQTCANGVVQHKNGLSSIGGLNPFKPVLMGLYSAKMACLPWGGLNPFKRVLMGLYSAKMACLPGGGFKPIQTWANGVVQRKYGLSSMGV